MKKKTELTHLGRDPKFTGHAVNPAISRASTILFNSVAEMQHAARHRHQHVEYYGRRGTSTTFAFQQAMAKLDNAAGCFAYPCGTSAITASLMSFLSSGDHLLVVDSVYGPTRDFCDGTLARMGVTTQYYDPMIGAEIKTLIKLNTKVIFLESPGSLTMEVQDVPAIVNVAKQHQLVTLIDNTYATPLNFKPLDIGVDVSIQSATKYICGHSDVMIGVACANEEHWPTLRERSFELGLCTSVDDIYTTLRGLRTLSVRLQQHESSALRIAEWLAARDEIDHVRHPALATCPGNEFFTRDFSGSNGLFSFLFKSNYKPAVEAFLDNLQHFKMGFSWGGYESLALPSFSIKNARTVTNWDYEGTLIRLHIGLEDPDDLIQDLEQGLERYIRVLAKS